MPDQAGPTSEMTNRESSKDLRSQAARGVVWTGGGQLIRQLVQVGGQLALVRLLVPDDFGVLGMALFFVGIGQLLADFGVGSAIVQARSDDRVMLSSCFWLNVVIAAALTVVVLTISPLIAIYYKREDVGPIVSVLSLNLLLAGVMVVPTALLNRDMRFADLARSQVVGSLAGALVAISLAFSGAKVWSLVAQPLVGSTVSLLWAWRATGWLPSMQFSWQQVKPIARFSFALLGTNLVGYANRNADSLLIGRFLGASPLGFYSMAIQLMLYPLQQVSSVIVRVLFPTLVQLKDDLPRLRSAYVKAVGAIALVTFPLMGGLFALADDFVQILFGASWFEMIPVLKVLCWVGMLQSIGTTVGTIYLSTGNPSAALRVTLIGAPILIGGMAIGLPWGILGVAVGYAIATLSFFYYTLHVAFGLIDLDLRSFHRILVGPILATAGMIAILMGTGLFLDSWPVLARFSINILIGTCAYFVISFLVNRAQIDDIFATLKSLRRARAT